MFSRRRYLTEKCCTTCCAVKPLTEFFPKASGAGGVEAKCKECRNAQNKQNYVKRRGGVVRCRAYCPETGLKRCNRCHEPKELTEFSLKAGSSDGCQPACKDCNKKYLRGWFQKNRERLQEKSRQFAKTDKGRKYYKNWRAKYDRARRNEAAGRPKSECCEACGATDVRIVYDHDHHTGQFRGWLCDKCNYALGSARDSVEVLQKLIAYLQEYGSYAGKDIKYKSPELPIKVLNEWYDAN